MFLLGVQIWWHMLPPVAQLGIAATAVFLICWPLVVAGPRITLQILVCVLLNRSLIWLVMQQGEEKEPEWVEDARCALYDELIDEETGYAPRVGLGPMLSQSDRAA